MTIHVVEESLFFRTSMPIVDQQRLLVIPAGKSLAVGDKVFLRSKEGPFRWVADVLFIGETEGSEVWNGVPEARERFAIFGCLARIHPGVLPEGRARLQANWVTLNRKTLATALPWWEEGMLVYHSTLRLVEGVFTRAEVEKGEALGCVLEHPSGHWVIPHGEARKRFLVQVRGVPLICGLCGAPIDSLEEATQDHIIPVSQGGPDSIANVQLAHRSCNEVKGNALPEQYPAFFTPPDAESLAIDRNGRYRRRGQPAGRGRGRGRGAAAVPAITPAPAAEAPPVVEMPLAVAAPVKARGSKTGKTAKKKKSAVAETAPAAIAAVQETGAQGVGAQETGAQDAGARKATRKGRTGKPASAKAASGKATSGRAASTKEAREAAADLAEWLEEVQGSTWSRLLALAAEKGWAARTAELRTLQQIRRGQIAPALAEGLPLAEASGPEGRFRLLDWKGQSVLVEEHGNHQSLHQVRMLRAITPDAYVSYLSRFGLTAPLTVAMALMAACNQGTAGDDGRIAAWRGDQPILLRIEEDRITECVAPEDTQVA